MDSVVDCSTDRVRVWQEVILGFAQSHHETLGLFGPETAVPGLAAGRDADSGVGRGNLSGDTYRGQSQMATTSIAEESFILSDYHTDAAWGPIGETSVVEVSGHCASVNPETTRIVEVILSTTGVKISRF